MCIAIAKKIHSKCPSLDTLRNCWDSNPDGAGFAFNDAGRVVIKKGFMTWNDFKTAWLRYSKRYDFDNRGVLIHFRIRCVNWFHLVVRKAACCSTTWYSTPYQTR